MRPAALLLALACVAGCRTEAADVEYGEPVGVKVDTVELAIAVDKDRRPEDVMEAVVGAVMASVKKCPGVTTEASSGRVAELAFRIEAGAIRAGKHDGPTAADCVLGQLEGQPAKIPADPAKPGPVHVLVQLRAAEAKP